MANMYTEKVRLEQELKESEARYRDIFEKANDPMYIHDASGIILDANETGLSALKCTREEFIGSHISRWLTKESFLEFKERLVKRIAGEPVEQPAVIEVICKDGEHRWAEIRTRVVYEKGRVKEIHGIARDITEKRRLEEKLRESEAKYRDLFENAQDAMYVLDTEGIVLKMNRVGLAILGCTKEEVIGKNISNWLTSESNKIVEERRKKIRSDEPVNQTEVLKIVSKNGEHRWIEIKTRRIKGEGRTIEVHGIGRDITENKILKQELYKSNRERNLLCYLIKGTRGGKTRALILRHLTANSYNAHQLSKVLNLDYKTVRHHLNVLTKNGIINVEKNRNNNAIYFISNNVSAILNRLG